MAVGIIGMTASGLAATGRSDTLDAMATTQNRSSQGRGSHALRRGRGNWVVLSLLVIGIIAGMAAVRYWNMQARFLKQPQEPAEGAGAAVWDEQVAGGELATLGEQFNELAGDGGDAQAIVKQAWRLVERYPKFAAARTLLGQILLYQDRFGEALEQFELSLGLNARQPEVHLLAGTLAGKLGDFNKATHHYSMAVGLDAHEPRYKLHLAQAYVTAHRQDEARDLLLEALRLDSSLHQGYALLADIYAQQNRLTLALPQIQKAIDQTPVSQRGTQVVYIRRKAALLRRDNRPQQALLVLDALSPSEQLDPGVMHEMAVCWSILGKPGQAAELYERVLAKAPTRWELAAEAAKWRIKAGDVDAARRLVDHARNVNPRAAVIQELEQELGRLAGSE